jgi:manganese/iron transport system permease protein
MFGLGIVLNTSIQTGVHLHDVLFGDMLGITWRDVAEAGAIAAVVVLAIAFKWRDLLLHAFDGQHARAIGLPVRRLHYGLLSLIALAIVAGLKAVGIILVIAVLIAPGATAFLITRRFGPMMLAAVAIAVFSSLAGVYLSFFLDSAPAPTIVLMMSSIFAAAFLATRRRSPGTVTGETVTRDEEKPRSARAPGLPS